MTIARQKGFTLVELVVALAVAATLLGVGVPSFNSAIRNSRNSSQYNAVVAALYLARSEAVKSSDLVVMCARATDTSCGSSAQWTNGWIVFVDATGSDADTSVSIDAGDTILRIESPISGDNTISAYSYTSSTPPVKAASAFVRYQPRGDAHWQTGSILICDSQRGSDQSRIANVVLTGDIRPGRRSAGDTAPRDVANKTIDCPADDP